MNLYRIPEEAVAITPSDTAFVDLCGFYVGGTGDVTVVDGGGNVTPLKALPVGAVIELRVVKVMATGTTATNIVGFKAR
jgi:hypothetical protein